MKEKIYCVHVYPAVEEYENIKADSPKEAEEKIMRAQYASDYENVGSVEVMLQCEECGYDNDPAAKVCDECGNSLEIN